jgi:hypothetical protein
MGEKEIAAFLTHLAVNLTWQLLRGILE